MSTTIHVYLLDEGVDVWRPVSAKLVRGDIYQITGTSPIGDQRLEFVTGDTVRCRQHNFSDGKTGLVAYEKVLA